MTSENKAREIARKVEEESRELTARASFIADQEMNGGASSFDLEMLRDSASSVAFWAEELERAVRK